jgi:2-phosphosulfolactate phosphatase
MHVDLEFCAKDARRVAQRRDVIIVIDVLRSGTSIVNALANGADKVIPVVSLKEAYDLHGRYPNYLLAGERGGKKPRGFKLGNSPLEFTGNEVDGKTLILTTTSGTRALVNSRNARCVLVGVFLNARAAAKMAEESAAKEEANVSFVLAGEKGKFALEDCLCAGGIMDEFTTSGIVFSDTALIALLAFRMAKKKLVETIMQTRHAKHLASLGFREDVTFSCKLNVVNVVPVYKNGEITLHG